MMHEEMLRKIVTGFCDLLAPLIIEVPVGWLIWHNINDKTVAMFVIAGFVFWLREIIDLGKK